MKRFIKRTVAMIRPAEWVLAGDTAVPENEQDEGCSSQWQQGMTAVGDQGWGGPQDLAGDQTKFQHWGNKDSGSAEDRASRVGRKKGGDWGLCVAQ